MQVLVLNGAKKTPLSFDFMFASADPHEYVSQLG